MASIRLKRGNAIVFQLLRKNLAGFDEPARIWKEVKVITLAVQPTYIDYNYRGRSQVNQTQERKGFVDKFGMLFTQVNMGGSFGSAPRRVGLSLKDGYTRLIEFRDEMVRKSNRVNDELDQKEATNANVQNIYGQTLQPDINARYVYAVNFYDFINDEMFAIDINNFNIRLDAGYNTVLPTYKMGFQEIGDTIKVDTKDGVLRALLWMSEGISAVQNELDFATNYIASTEIFQMAELSVSFVEQISFQMESLSGVLTSYSDAVFGRPTPLSSISSGNALQFSSVKG